MMKTIKRRTLAGRFGPDSYPRVPRRAGGGSVNRYSREYASRKGVSRNSVNLRDTGNMLAGLYAGNNFRGDTITSFVEQRGNAQDKRRTRWHNSIGAGPGGAVRRQFLYISGGEYQSILRRVAGRVAALRY